MTAPPTHHGPADIRRLAVEEAGRRIDELIGIARDAVDGGASINFLADVTDDELGAFWRSSLDEQQAGGRLLLVAEIDDRIAGTAMLIFAPQQNSPHRADVGKMIVHSAFRRRGIGAALLGAIEEIAREHGRTLLMLDTETGSAGEELYVAAGWVRYGEVPGHALRPDGTAKPTTFFYKIVG